MQTILITGGSGFIGSNFIRHLLAQGAYAVVNLDALTYAGNPENLKDVETNPHYTFVHGRIEDVAVVEGVLKKHTIAAVVHFAAESHVDRSIVDAAPFLKTNVIGTHILLDACRRARVPLFVHISTDEVYGALGETGTFTEQSPLSPNSPYAASKAAGDLLVRSYVETFRFPAIVVRCSNNYGPYQFPEKFIPLLITNLMSNEKVPLYGDGLHVRDWIFVEDFCRGIEMVLAKGAAGQVYNFGGKSERTNLSVTEKVLEILKKPRALIMPVEDRAGHDRRYAIDISKVTKELGWQPRVSFDEGLARTVKWYAEHVTWWQRVKTGEFRKFYAEYYGKRLAGRG